MYKTTYVQQEVRTVHSTHKQNMYKSYEIHTKITFPKEISIVTQEHLNIKLGGNDRITIYV